MFNCDDIFEKTEEYLDGELSEDERISFEVHMEVCEQCKNNVELAKKLESVMRGMPSVEPPADFLENLHKRIAEEKKIVPFYRRWQPYSALAACVILAVVIKSAVVNDLNETTNYIDYSTPLPTAVTDTAITENAVENAGNGERNENTAQNGAYETAKNDTVSDDAKNSVLDMAAASENANKQTAAPAKAKKKALPEADKTDSEQSAAEQGQNTQSISEANIYKSDMSKEKVTGEAQESGGNVYGHAQNDDVTAQKNIPEPKPTEAPKAKAASQDSAAVSGVSKAAATSEYYVTQNAAENSVNISGARSSGSSGGGGGSSSASASVAMTAPTYGVTANTIDKSRKDEVLKIISELEIEKTDVGYIADEDKYKEFVRIMDEKDISFSGVCKKEGNTVQFDIIWK